MKRALAAALAVGLLAGCAAPAEKPLPPDHPANPDAPESQFEPSTTLDPAGADPIPRTEAGAPPAHEGHGASMPSGSAHGGHSPATPASPTGTAAPAPAAAVTYVCPMHPEVTSSAPGKCPKCGMDLVPAKNEGGGH